MTNVKEIAVANPSPFPSSLEKKKEDEGSIVLPLPSPFPPAISTTHDTTHINHPSLTDRLRKIPGAGLLMALISGICFATAGFMVEMMRHVDPAGVGVDSAFVVVSRSVIQLIFFLPATLYYRQPLFGIRGERWSLLQRAIFGFIAFTLSYYALSFVSLSDSSAIAFSAPVYVSIFACILLKEPCGAFQIATIVVTLVGVLLIARPTFLDFLGFDVEGENEGDVFTPEKRVIGITLALITSLSMSYTFIAMRRLQKTPTMTVITVFSVFCIVAGLVVMGSLQLIEKEEGMQGIRLPTLPIQWFFVFINGMCGVIGQTLLVLALKIERAGLVSLARTFDIVMAFIYQVAFLDQPVYWTSILGAVIVCSGCVAVAVQKLANNSSHVELIWERFSNSIMSLNISSGGSGAGDRKRPSTTMGTGTRNSSRRGSSTNDNSSTFDEEIKSTEVTVPQEVVVVPRQQESQLPSSTCPKCQCQCGPSQKVLDEKKSSNDRAETSSSSVRL